MMEEIEVEKDEWIKHLFNPCKKWFFLTRQTERLLQQAMTLPFHNKNMHFFHFGMRIFFRSGWIILLGVLNGKTLNYQ